MTKTYSYLMHLGKNNSTPPPPPPPLLRLNRLLILIFLVLPLIISCADNNNADPTPPTATQKLTVTFNVNKPTGVIASVSNAPDTITVEKDKTVTEPTPAPTLTGYTFAGWYLSTTPVTNATAFDFATHITENITLYAKWSRIQVTITYNANKPNGVTANATGVPTSPITVNSGETVTEPTPAPTLTGYTFAGWYLSATPITNATAFDFATPITENITLYAKWSRIQVTITYNANKPNGVTANATGVPTSPITVNSGETTTAPTPAPTLTGYTFAGWFTEVVATNRFNFSSPITANITLHAKWTRKTYTITYNGNKPTNAPATSVLAGLPTTNPVTVNSGDQATAPATPPTITGYNFAGWYTETETTNEFDFTTPITANITLHAKWTRKTYTITYNGNKPTNAPATSVLAGLPTTNPVTVNSGDQATAPATPPTLTGYTFGGWFTEAGATNKFDFATPITENITLHAKWTRKTYTITYNGNKPTNAPATSVLAGLPTTNPVTVNSGDQATAPATPPTITGYNFAGWYTEAETTNKFDFANTPITANITLYAKWLNTYTITYHPNKPNSASLSEPVLNIPAGVSVVTHGQRASAPNSPPTLANYNFLGWFAGAGTPLTIETTAFDFSAPITENKNIYAKWSQKPVVRFDTQGGSSIDPVIINSDTQTVARPTDPTRVHYTFNNWFDNPTVGGSVVTFPIPAPITANKIIYARWNVIHYRVTYNANLPQGVSATPTGVPTSPITVNSGQTATEPTPPPTLTDYTFGGWYTEESTTNRFNFSTPITGNKTLYAKWNIVQYRVVYNANLPQGVSATPTGVPTGPITVNSGQTATEPTPAPTLIDYTFGGWFTEATPATNATAFNFSTPITENKILYAKWTRNQYRITYNANLPQGVTATPTGIPATPEIVNKGQTATEPTPAPTLTDYTFGGWFLSATPATNRFNFSTPITEHKTLYAKWTRIQITITYHGNKPSSTSATIVGLAPDPKTDTVNSGEIATPPEPTLTGYNFGGWFTEASTTNIFDFNLPVRGGNKNLYARWTSGTTYTVSFNNSGVTGVTNTPSPQSVASGGKATMPTTAPTHTDYVFNGWYTDADLDTVFDFANTDITQNTVIYAKWGLADFSASMAWVSMREGLLQFDNGTQGARTIGVIASADTTIPTYDSVKDLPGFYTRVTKADGTARTVYFSMTDKMTSTILSSNVTKSVDGAATGFVSAIASVPEILHPDTDYYVHFFDIKDSSGIAIHKLQFKTEDFPTTYPTSRGTYSSFYTHIASDSTKPNIEYKATEKYLIPIRLHYEFQNGGPYIITLTGTAPYEITEASQKTRPFGNTVPRILLYDLYNIAQSGPMSTTILWDSMFKINNINNVATIASSFGLEAITFYYGNNMDNPVETSLNPYVETGRFVLVTE